MNGEEERISRWWRYSVVIVVLIGFAILTAVTKLTYDNAPPIPKNVIDPSGAVLFTKEQILEGQSVFFRYNLMEHGTLWGHGAYLGPDYSAKHLHETALTIRDILSQKFYQKPFDQLAEEERNFIQKNIPPMVRENRYDSASGTLVYTEEQAEAFRKSIDTWRTYFAEGLAPGLYKNYISNPKDLYHLVTFFSWAGWAASTKRLDANYTYTNNFPYDPLIGNNPSADAYFWSAMSLITLLGGIGLLLFMFGKFDFLGWKSESMKRHAHVTHLQNVGLFPSQRNLGKYFILVAILFLMQSILGGGLAHYRVESTFYGLNIAKWFPYNLMRTWHLQMAIFWIATAWVGGGLFIAPMLANRDPAKQGRYVNLLFYALALVIFGSLIGEFLTSRGYLEKLWFWFGNQGSEYLDLGRAWQYLLIAGFLFWLFVLYRALRLRDSRLKQREMMVLFFIAAAAIPFFYTPAVFYDHQTNFSIIDNWRFWIIHLWVEGFFEVFATVMVAIIFVKMGIVRYKVALRVIYLDAILYLGSGVVGTGHHWYFTGQTNINMALSACFSAMEVVPLTLLTLDAWDFITLSKTRCPECGKFLTGRQKWTVYFLIAVGVWNFIGAGIFGFLINLPIISYFEVGTSLTANHAHTALFGVFGMLALAICLFCIRHAESLEVWKKTEKWIKLGFWGLNAGLSLMVLLDLFPGGILQLWDAINNGYWHARELQYIMSGTYHTLEIIRIIGDTIFIGLGVFPIAWAIIKMHLSRKVKVLEPS